MSSERRPGRLAAMGGTYGNLAALEACLDDAEASGAERRAFLGDSIGCCGHSEQVVRMIHERFEVRVAGNHEQQAAAKSDSCGCGYSSAEDEAISCEAFRLATEALSDETRAQLGRWPDRAIVEMQGGRVLLCHGSPGHTSEFLYEVELDDLRLEAWLDGFDVRGFVCTHSGLPWVRRLRGGRFAVNCGAVGKPDHDGDPAVHYAIVDCPASGELGLHIRRVSYNHQAWARTMQQAGIAPLFVEPVLTGVWTTGIASLPAAERHRYLRDAGHAAPSPRERRWQPERLEARAFASTLTEAVELGLLTIQERDEAMTLFDPAFPFFAALRHADSVHLHVKVDQVSSLPRAALVALGGRVENERPGYIKFVFAGGVNLIFSSIEVAEEDRLDLPPVPRPFVDHLGVDLRRETGVVRAAFDEVPALARRAGWAHAPQGGLARPVYCCHVQVAAKHWVYPLGEGRFTRPVEFAFGPLVLSAESSGCDLRPIDPRHPAAGLLAACGAPASPPPA